LFPTAQITLAEPPIFGRFSRRFSFTDSTALLMTGTGFLFAVVAALLGFDLGGAIATSVACIAILFLGLPHGAFDWFRLRAGHGIDKGFAKHLATYLLLMLLTWSLWQVAPSLALGSFLAISIFHFAEDWVDQKPPELDAATPQISLHEILSALSPFSMIALAHGADLRSLFALITHDSGAAIWVDVLIMASPISLGFAAVRMVNYVQSGSIVRAASALIILASMALFPPIIGFALYFCLHHSPHHFSQCWDNIPTIARRRSAVTIAIVTIVSLLLAALLFGFAAQLTWSNAIIASVFLTLSILTVPHMLVPEIIR
jgi:Brp/Blh family beta-carotene 15,15'-monooxygenase